MSKGICAAARPLAGQGRPRSCSPASLPALLPSLVLPRRGTSVGLASLVSSLHAYTLFLFSTYAPMSSTTKTPLQRNPQERAHRPPGRSLGGISSPRLSISMSIEMTSTAPDLDLTIIPVYIIIPRSYSNRIKQCYSHHLHFDSK